MKIKATAIATALLGTTLLFGGVAKAQAPLKVRIDPTDSSNPPTIQVTSEFIRLLSLDSHFMLVNDEHFDLQISITCLRPVPEFLACSFQYLYEPENYLGMIEPLYEGCTTSEGNRPEKAAQFLFTALIQSSTPDVIGATKHRLDTTAKAILRAGPEFQRKAREKAGPGA
jgi:hypothetical protein